ncbi:response regulator [Paenibacillus sp. MWE-103]|uniref:Response regulator n=1 Tax=Paenibacillus artemisiicola TaxID=1172618 RepID=A0ABS3WK47_9BACL|nr:response regulator [Paenibacillus artemisiicola]MBO7748466.1 response regulator [Paenibacillus artemisiicola]
MLKLMIVDDELWIREGLKQTVDWPAHGIRLIGEAENGKQALELAASEAPDIILSDIRMPGMDGMALMEEAKRQGIDAKVILISGFSDFAYAQRAVQLGAFDYMLKPIEEDVLLRIIDRCTAEILQKRKLSSRLTKLTELARESVPLARQKHLELCLSRPMAEHELQPIWRALDIDLNPDRLVVLSAVVHDWGERGLSEQGCALMRYALGKLMEETLAEEGGRALACPLQEHAYADAAVLADPGAADAPGECAAVRRSAERAALRAQQVLGIRISIGASGTVDRRQLSSAFREALTNNMGYFVHGGDRVFAGADGGLAPAGRCGANGGGSDCRKGEAQPAAPKEPEAPRDEPVQAANRTELLDTSLSNRMIHALQLSDGCRLAALLDEQLERLRESAKHSPAMSVRSELNLFIDLLLSKWREHCKSDEALRLLKLQLYRCPLQDWKATVLAAFLPHRAGEAAAAPSTKRAIDKALRYIHDNFHRGISLGDVAEAIYLNPSYFSRMFHAEVGEPLSKYLIRMRMSKAKELLEQTPLKVYEIADLVGYKDFRHFVKTFKEWEGMTPAQFRNYGA